MTKRDALNELLNKKPDVGALRRGKGLTLSIEQEQPPRFPSQGTQPGNEWSAKTHKRTIAPASGEKPLRVNRGYKLREDIIKRCKALAVDNGVPLYTIMENALLDYLKGHEK